MTETYETDILRNRLAALEAELHMVRESVPAKPSRDKRFYWGGVAAAAFGAFSWASDTSTTRDGAGFGAIILVVGIAFAVVGLVNLIRPVAK